MSRIINYIYSNIMSAQICFNETNHLMIPVKKFLLSSVYELLFNTFANNCREFPISMDKVYWGHVIGKSLTPIKSHPLCLQCKNDIHPKVLQLNRKQSNYKKKFNFIFHFGPTSGGDATTTLIL